MFLVVVFFLGLVGGYMRGGCCLKRNFGFVRYVRVVYSKKDFFKIEI